jgi:hypothetical protein
MRAVGTARPRFLRAGNAITGRRPACYHRRCESNDGANNLKKPTHDDITIAMPCPTCADITRKHFEWFLRHTMCACGKCGALIQVDPGYRRTAEAYEQLVKALNAAFREFFDD